MKKLDLESHMFNKGCPSTYPGDFGEKPKKTINSKVGNNKLVSAIVLGHSVSHIFNSSLPLLLSMMKTDPRFNLTATQFGVLGGVGKGASDATTIVAGYLGERFATRPGVMLSMSLTIMGGSYFFLGVAPGFYWVLSAMILVGIGPSLYHPPAIAELSNRFPNRRGFAISLHGTGGSLGEMLGPLITGLLTTETFKVGSIVSVTYLIAFQWDEVLRISALPALFFAVLVYLMMQNVSKGSSGKGLAAEYFQGLRELLKIKGIWGLIFVTGLSDMALSCVTYFLPLYLISDPVEGGLGKDAFTVGFFLGGAQVAGIFAQPSMGWLSDRYGRKIVLLPAMTILGILFIGLHFASDGYLLVLNVFAMGAFLYSLHTVFIAAAMDVAGGKSQATVVSLIYSASLLGIASPIFTGFLIDEFGLTAAFLFSGIISLLATIILFAIKLPMGISMPD